MPKVHTLKIKYSNGTEGIYVGRCPFEEKDVDEIKIEEIEVGPIEDISEEIINKIRAGEYDG